jgi:hypothetical protein
MQEMAREMERTTFVKKVITDVPAGEVLEQAQSFFREFGYRAGKAGKPNTVRLMGRAEGGLPSVIGEIEVRTTNKGRTIVGLSGYGEGLSERLREFHDRMRAARKPKEARPAAPVGPRRAESRTEQIEEEMLEAQEEKGEEYAFSRDRYEGDDRP